MLYPKKFYASTLIYNNAKKIQDQINLKFAGFNPALRINFFKQGQLCFSNFRHLIYGKIIANLRFKFRI